MVGEMAASSHAEESALLATFKGGHMLSPELISIVWEELGTVQRVMYLENVIDSLVLCPSLSQLHGCEKH